MLPPIWCATYIILLDQCYTRLEKSIASPATIMRHLHHMDHPLDLRCHPLQYVCSPFEVEGEGEGEGEKEFIAEVVVEMVGEVMDEMVGEVMVEMVRAVVVHLSRLCLLRYPPYLPLTQDFIPPHTDTSPSIPPHTYTSSSIPPNTYTSLPYPLSPKPKPASIAVDIIFSPYPLSSPTLPPIGDIILDLVLELSPLPARRPRAPRIRRVLHPSAP